MPLAMPARLRPIAIAGLTAVILAAPAAVARAHEFEPGDDHGGAVVTPVWPTGIWTVSPVGGSFADDHGVHVEPGDDHGRDG